MSVIADRARVRHIEGLAQALATIFRDGATRAAEAGDGPRREPRAAVSGPGAPRDRHGPRPDWLVFAHLVADFVLQNDWIAMNKATGGREGWRALGVHGFHVGLCLVPAVLAFGARGVVYLVVVVVTHMIVDRWKVQATRRAESEAQAQARARIERRGRRRSRGSARRGRRGPGSCSSPTRCSTSRSRSSAGW